MAVEGNSPQKSETEKPEKLTKHEMRGLRRKEAKDDRKMQIGKNSKVYLKYLGLFAVLVVIGIFISSQNNQAPTNITSNTTIPNHPIHWHPKLTIRINGSDQLIPAGIGLVGAEQPIHTHEPDNVLHMENNNPTEENMKLGFFFKVWGKAFNNTCIFEYCNTEKQIVKMTVNGKENKDFENYIMQDKDEIVIEYD